MLFEEEDGVDDERLDCKIELVDDELMICRSWCVCW